MDVHLLGPLSVTRDDVTLRVDGRKERAVLATLALRVGQFVPVADLVEALWADAPPATAAKTLQGHISRLRRALGAEVVVTRRSGYLLDLPVTAIDLHRMLERAERARASALAGDHADALVDYRRALAEWNGDPLPDLARSELGRREIAGLVELRLTLAEELLEARLAVGEHHLAIPTLEALVRETPLRERPWRLLMLALYRSGRQADALRAFQAVRARLIDDIGVEPDVALQELEAAIIAHDPSLQLAPAGAAAPDPPVGAPDDSRLSSLAWAHRTAQPFAGRDAELAHIDGAWADCVALGLRHGVLVGGDPGIGKTRLVGEAAHRIHDAGGVVLFGACAEGLGAPYQPFVEALGAFLRATPRAQVPDLIGPLGPELTRLLPDLLDVVPSLEPPETSDPDAERHRLFESVSEVLERLSTSQPVLLVIDDLQWATMPTLLLLRHLLSAARPARLLVVGTYRTTDLDRVHPLAGILADLRRQARTTRVGLEGLDQGSIVTLASRAAQHDLDDAAVTLLGHLHELVGGNPFFFWTMLTHLVDTGLVVRRDGRWTHATGAIDAPLPEGIREVVARRLSSLDDRTNVTLRVAALLGPSFDYRVLAEVTGLADDEVLDALDHSRRAGVVVEQAETFGRYGFAHDIMRRSLLEELSTTRRTRLHWRITEVLQARDGRAGGVAPDELARHATEGALAGDLGVAGTIVQRAGDAALDALAFEEAATYYEDALALSDEADHERRYTLLLAKGRALHRAGNLTYRAAIEGAVEAARQLHDAERMATAVLELHHDADLTISAVNDPAVPAMLREALAALDDIPATAGPRARLTSALALTIALSEQRDHAVDLARHAEAVARGSGDAHVLAQVLFDRSWVIAGPDTPHERVAIGTEIVELATRLGDTTGAANGRNCLAKAWLELGAVALARDAIDQGMHLAASLRNPAMAWSFRVLDASLAALQADVPTIDRLAHELLASGTELGIEPGTLLAVHSRLLLAARQEQGRLAELEEVFEASVARQPELPWVVVLGMVHADAGRIDAARAVLEQLRDRTINRDVAWVVITTMAAITVCATGDRAAAGPLYDDLLPLAGRNAHDGAATLGPIDLGLGRLAALLGRPVEATRHYTDAAALCRAWQAPMWLAHCLSEHADVVEAADPEVAAAMRDEAWAIADACGQDRLLTRLADRVRPDASAS